MTAPTPDCWCDLVNVEPHAAGDHPTETPGTPATTFPTSELWHSVVAALTAELGGRAVVTLPLQRWSIVDALLEVVAEDVAAREVAAREEGRAERDAESDALRTRLANLLTDTANALKGDPGPLRAHDWSDLPRVAAELRAELMAAEQRGAEALTVLRELVRLKDGPRDAAYERAKPKAWAAARRLLVERLAAAAVPVPDTTHEGDPS